jgi:MFS family permease
MKSSFTIGALAGIVAGFWTGIIQDPLFVALGIMDWPLPKDIYFTILSAIPSLGYGAIFGAFFGLLAAIFFDRISGKRIQKGLAIGLIYCLFSALYPVYAYWVFDNTLWAYIFLLTSPIDKFIYGIVFAFLYKPSK